MEKSSKLRKLRLTINETSKKHRSNDSPKTPIRVTESPDRFGTPRRRNSATNNHINNSPNSTPIARKRSHFLEESPSQDYDNCRIILPSQSCNKSNILDVGWKWDESPGSSKKTIRKNKKSIKKPTTSISIEKQNLENTNTNSMKTNMNKQQITNKKQAFKDDEEELNNQGFYKFRQELMKIRELENEVLNIADDDDDNELDSSLKENKNILLKDTLTKMKSDEESNNIEQQTTSLTNTLVIKKDITSMITTKTNNARNGEREIKTENPNAIPLDTTNDINDLFDDSDTDHFLIELSQKLETEIKQSTAASNNTNAVSNKTTKSLIKENIIFDNDSFDDILFTIPIDDEVDKEIKIPTKTNNVSSKATELKTNSPKFNFSRYNSMPVTSVANKNAFVSFSSTSTATRNVTKSFVRHNSMPENQIITVQKPTSSTTAVISSSNGESNKAKTFSNSLEDIERRKQEAKQRLMMTMQKKLQTQVKKNFC